MREVWVTQYVPGEFREVPGFQRDLYIKRCIDKVKVEGQPYFYEREGNSFICAVKLGNKVQWFDCTMSRWGGETV